MHPLSLSNSRCPSLLSDNTETSTDDEEHFANTYSAPMGPGAGHKRKREEMLGQAGVEPRQQKLQSKEMVPQTNPEMPAKELEVREAEQQERHDPISYWAAHHTWPRNFAEHSGSSISISKRQITEGFQSGEDESPWNYAQSRKLKADPEQYTVAYEEYILSKGLDMCLFKGMKLVSEESEKLCIDVWQMTHQTIEPTIFPTEDIHKVIHFCQDRNEGTVTRYITPMIIPSIMSLYFGGDNSLEHVVDEVNTEWYAQCVLEGPRPRPHLAVGLSSSAFTHGEIDKLRMYATVDNWTRTTTHMFFPFLMCEVKCGYYGLDIADRRNMHSCSVAVRAIRRIQQAADQCRPEKKTDSLDGKFLVFSISHNEEYARLYGHFAIAQGQTWTYHRYRIQTFDIAHNNNNGLHAINNFVRKILKSYLPVHVQRLKDALDALPDLKTFEWSCPSGSSGPSVAASGIRLNEDGSQQDFQSGDAEGFIDRLIEEFRRKNQEDEETMDKRQEASDKWQEAMDKRQEAMVKQIKILDKIKEEMKELDKLEEVLNKHEEVDKHKEAMERLVKLKEWLVNQQEELSKQEKLMEEADERMEEASKRMEEAKKCMEERQEKSNKLLEEYGRHKLDFSS
ncbi:hypothetical protein MMC07_002817 [Pseudocyphellaria aurata]|nr:hypothetical protein [Pseudocyphellaria aurata]